MSKELDNEEDSDDVWNKTKPCPWLHVLDGFECNAKKCKHECEPKRGGKHWR